MTCANKASITYQIIAGNGATSPSIEFDYTPPEETRLEKIKNFINEFLLLSHKPAPSFVETHHKIKPENLLLKMLTVKKTSYTTCKHQNYLDRNYVEDETPMYLRYCFDCGTIFENDCVIGSPENWDQLYIHINGVSKRYDFVYNRNQKGVIE